MRTQFLPTVGVAAAAALFAGAAYLYTVRISRRSGGGFTIGTVPSRAAKQPLGRQEEPKEEDPKPRVDVYFGSQTGTAEDFAKQVQREGNARGLDMNVVDLELYDKARISSGTAVFLVATYGEGEPTDNGRDFHDWVSCEEDETALSGLNFAVFGLGNSQYEHFNSFGKAVDRHVARLGGKRLLNLALGDDDNDLRDAFEDWLDKLWPALSDHLGVDQSSVQCKDAGVQYHYTLRYIDTAGPPPAPASPTFGRSKSNHMLDDPACVELRVSVNRELHAGGGRSCRHLELDTSAAGSLGHYETGDHVAIYPDNDDAQVARLAARLGADIDAVVALEDGDGQTYFPCPCRVGTALRRFLDVNAAPKKHFLVALAEHTAEPAPRARLLHLAARENQDAFHAHVLAGRRTHLDILEEFSSAQPPLGAVLQLLPRLHPRYYSISSSSRVAPGSVHVTAVVVRDELPGGREFRGVCTNYLARQPPGATLSGLLRRTAFKLPPDSKTPCIFIGAGTGLAPLRGMCIELQSRKQAGEELGHNMLIFGCRNRKHDYIYQEEIEGWAADGTLGTLHLAFSRDDESFKGKVYVQHKVDEDGARILSLLDQGGCIFVCGSTSMAREVQKALIAALMFLRNMSGNRAEAFLEDLAKAGRYHKDVWST